MSSGEEKQRRAQLRQQARETACRAFVGSLPVSRPLFQELCNWLDEKLSESECDDTLQLTEQFAQARGISFEALKAWLHEQGGYCDCEVLANVEEKFEGIA